MLVEVVPATTGPTSPAIPPTTTGPSGPAIPPTAPYQDLAVAVPASETVAAGATLAIAGVSINDPWAAAAPGTMALNIYDKTGTITIAGQTFGPGGTHGSVGMIVATEAQINADLAGLTYTAGATAGTDTLSVNVWNQAGVDVTKTIPITVTPPPYQDLAVAVPASETVAAGATLAIAGVSITDPWAADRARHHGAEHL